MYIDDIIKNILSKKKEKYHQMGINEETLLKSTTEL